ncbi:MAG TPA: interleukin-like EMT inducer domain-containing protein, partial [Bacteroidota bacterium]|nr:interleukin-like EMT inducer domain-containing protein [Bacteroidota bacterium]
SAEWTTPALADATLYFWRAKSFSSTISNAWVTSSFRTSSTLPSAPLVRWSESSSGQFLEGVTNRTTVTDSGVAISAQLPSHIYARSLGNRADANKDYYSTLQLDDQVMIGLWWIQGNGFLAMRADPVSRIPLFHAFDVPNDVTQSDSMQNFLTGSPAGNFIALSVVFDGRTNVSTGLRNSIKALGSALIDSVQPGDAWAFIAQVGGGSPPLESWSRLGMAADSVALQNAYSAGSGTFTGIQLPMPQRWQTFRWTASGASGTTNARVAIVGIRSNAGADTLRVIPRDSSVADLSSLNAVTADPSYVSWRAVSLLSSADAKGTPLLRNWSADFEPPADLAISSHSLSAPKIQIPKGTAGSVTLGVYNIGYRKVDSARVVLSLVQPDNSLQPIAYAEVDSIPVGGEQTVQVSFPTIGLPAQFTIQARVSPPNSSKELIWENNVALYNYIVQVGPPLSAKISVYADGVQLMDGDYVESRPKILVHLYDLTGGGSTPPAVDLFVDNLLIGSPSAPVLSKGERPAIRPLDDPTFMPVLSNGAHELRVRVTQLNALGLTDSVIQQVGVNVTDQYKILQMFNYPNPFGSDTWFTFVLTGNAPPDELIVRIYTVAGRKIREIVAPPGSLAIGFNKLYWDGRDADGDQVANGNYLYMVELHGGGKTQTAIGKLSRIR